MYKFHYDYIKIKYGNNSRLFFTDTDSLMYEMKMEDVYEDFSKDREMFDFGNYSAESKYYDDSNKLVVGKMEYKTVGVAIKKFVRLMHPFMEDDVSEHKKGKDMSKNVVITISHGKYLVKPKFLT